MGAMYREGMTSYGEGTVPSLPRQGYIHVNTASAPLRPCRQEGTQRNCGTRLPAPPARPQTSSWTLFLLGSHFLLILKGEKCGRTHVTTYLKGRGGRAVALCSSASTS